MYGSERGGWYSANHIGDLAVYSTQESVGSIPTPGTSEINSAGSSNGRTGRSNARCWFDSNPRSLRKSSGWMRTLS